MKISTAITRPVRTYHDEDGHGVGLELGVLLQRHVGVAQEGEHLLHRRRDLEDPAGLQWPAGTVAADQLRAHNTVTSGSVLVARRALIQW